jgi:hypothetical protein
MALLVVAPHTAEKSTERLTIALIVLTIISIVLTLPVAIEAYRHRELKMMKKWLDVAPRSTARSRKPPSFCAAPRTGYPNCALIRICKFKNQMRTPLSPRLHLRDIQIERDC